MSDRRGVATGDIMIGLSLLVLLAALLYPTVRARGVRAGLRQAMADVEAVRAAAVDHHRASGAWPSTGHPGVLPPELEGTLAGDTSLIRERYTLEWGRWDVVDLVPLPPNPEPTNDPPPDSVGPRMAPVVRHVGSLTVHSADEALLAELLGRFAAQGAFVRDTIWTLVLPERSGS